MKKTLGVAALLISLGAGPAWAGNDLLSKPQPVTAGERVANYLQSLMISAGAILEAKNPGDLLNAPEFYRVGVTYNPEEKVLEIAVVGNQGDPKTVRQKLELTQKIILSFNKRLQRIYGVTLAENDFWMDYLDAKSGQILLKYRDGQYSEASAPETTPAASPTPSGR